MLVPLIINGPENPQSLGSRRYILARGGPVLRPPVSFVLLMGVFLPKTLATQQLVCLSRLNLRHEPETPDNSPDCVQYLVRAFVGRPLYPMIDMDFYF